MTRADVVAILQADNPRASVAEVSMYADNFLNYLKGSENIAAIGAVVTHPRTMAPMPNPYLPVVAAAGRTMRELKRVKSTDRLWKLAGCTQ